MQNVKLISGLEDVYFSRFFGLSEISRTREQILKLHEQTAPRSL